MTARIPCLSVHAGPNRPAEATERYVVFHDDIAKSGGQVALIRAAEGKLRNTVFDVVGDNVELALYGAGTFVQENGRWVWRNE